MRMNFFRRLERKLGRYALPNLTLYIIVTYAAGYILDLFAPQVLSLLTLEPYLILHGQVWRLVSWILIPPSAFGLATLIMLFFYYSIGTTLERSWGAFLYNVYIFMGLLMTIVGSFLLYGILYLVYGQPFSMGAQFSTYYISMSIFFGFAMTYPEMQVMLYFLIPLKIKWLAYVYAIVMAYDLAQNLISGNWPACIAMLCSLANVIVFFFLFRGRRGYRRHSNAGRTQFTRAQAPGRAPANGEGRGTAVSIHKCAVCGRTEKDDPQLEFRFCSKCNGNYEYCQDHLFTHTHVQ